MPSTENELCVIICSSTGIIHNLLKQRIIRVIWVNIIRLHHNGSCFTTCLHKRHRQTGITTALGHNIHGEASGGEGDGVVGRGDRGHELIAVGAFVIDVQRLTVRKVGVGNGDHHRLALLGLPVGIAILNGNVVGALHLFALRHGALHLGGLHLRLGRHLAHHLKVSLRDLLLDGARLVGLRRTTVLRHHRRRHIHRSEKEQKSKDRQQKALHFSLGRCTSHTFCIFIIILIINTLRCPKTHLRPLFQRIECKACKTNNYMLISRIFFGPFHPLFINTRAHAQNPPQKPQNINILPPPERGDGVKGYQQAMLIRVKS